jgi:hypothetical protein
VPLTVVPRVRTFGAAQAKKWGSSPTPVVRPPKSLTYGPVRGVITSPLRAGTRAWFADEVIE